MFKKFQEINQKKKFIKKNDKILLAFSGGPDSTFLFFLLLEAKKFINFDFSICYIDHSLRPEEVLKEKEYAKFLSKKYKIKLFLRKISVKGKSNLEERLREKRYSVLEKIALKYGYNKIFTAHNKDDQVETFFLRLFRGAGTKGLCGIPERKKINENLEIIRPVLDFEKKKILEYLRRKKIKFFVDSSNYSLEFSRNVLRLKIIPVIKKFFPASINNIFKFQKILKTEDEFLKDYVEKIKEKILYFKNGNIYIARNRFLRYNKNLRRIILGRIFEGKFKFVNILDMLNLIENKSTTGRVILPFNMEMIRSGEKIVIRERKRVKRKAFVLKIGEKEYIEDFGFTVYIKKIKNFDEVDFSFSPKRKIYLDAENVRSLILRTRKEGDKIFIKDVGNKKIKEFFIDEKIPQWERDSIPLLEVNNKIVWVVGYKRSGDFLIDKYTKNILEVGVENS